MPRAAALSYAEAAARALWSAAPAASASLNAVFSALLMLRFRWRRRWEARTHFLADLMFGKRTPPMDYTACAVTFLRSRLRPSGGLGPQMRKAADGMVCPNAL
jgi:hypothetical protein